MDAASLPDIEDNRPLPVLELNLWQAPETHKAERRA
jgi:hypothetical protein